MTDEKKKEHNPEKKHIAIGMTLSELWKNHDLKNGISQEDSIFTPFVDVKPKENNTFIQYNDKQFVGFRTISENENLYDKVLLEKKSLKDYTKNSLLNFLEDSLGNEGKEKSFAQNQPSDKKEISKDNAFSLKESLAKEPDLEESQSETIQIDTSREEGDAFKNSVLYQEAVQEGEEKARISFENQCALLKEELEADYENKLKALRQELNENIYKKLEQQIQQGIENIYKNLAEEVAKVLAAFWSDMLEQKTIEDFAQKITNMAKDSASPIIVEANCFVLEALKTKNFDEKKVHFVERDIKEIRFVCKNESLSTHLYPIMQELKEFIR